MALLCPHPSSLFQTLFFNLKLGDQAAREGFFQAARVPVWQVRTKDCPGSCASFSIPRVEVGGQQEVSQSCLGGEESTSTGKQLTKVTYVKFQFLLQKKWPYAGKCQHMFIEMTNYEVELDLVSLGVLFFLNYISQTAEVCLSSPSDNQTLWLIRNSTFTGCGTDKIRMASR